MVHSNQPSEPISEDPLPSQSLKIFDAEVKESIIGGQSKGSLHQIAGNKIKGNLTQNFYAPGVQEGKTWSKDQLKQFQEREELLRAQFQEKLDYAKNLIEEIRRKIERQLNIKPETQKREILTKISELQALLYQEESIIEELEKEEASHYRAAAWLRENLTFIAEFTTSKVFSTETLPLPKGIEGSLSRGQVRLRFAADMLTYMRWITLYIPDGMDPKNIQKDPLDPVNLDLPREIYKKAFEHIKHDLLPPEVSGLPSEAANIIANYINLFLIDRDITSDKS